MHKDSISYKKGHELKREVTSVEDLKFLVQRCVVNGKRISRLHHCLNDGFSFNKNFLKDEKGIWGGTDES